MCSKYTTTIHTSPSCPKVDMPQVKTKEMYFKSRVDMYPELRRVVTIQAATPLEKLPYLKGDTDFVFGPKTGYLLCNYALPNMKGDGDLKWSFLLGDLYIKAIGQQLVETIQKSVDLDIYFGNNTDPDGLPKTNAGFRMDLDRIWQIGANASFGIVMPKRVKLIINAILPKPNVDVHTLYVDGTVGDANNPAQSMQALYRTDVTKIRAGVKGQ
ncbi:jg4875, partial [Pararge aegeria aegeria]